MKTHVTHYQNNTELWTHLTPGTYGGYRAHSLLFDENANIIGETNETLYYDYETEQIATIEHEKILRNT